MKATTNSSKQSGAVHFFGIVASVLLAFLLIGLWRLNSELVEWKLTASELRSRIGTLEQRVTTQDLKLQLLDLKQHGEKSVAP